MTRRDLFALPLAAPLVGRSASRQRTYKFLSALSIDRLGLRGYTLVLDDAGKPVTADKLFLAWIPKHIADQRRMKCLTAPAPTDARSILHTAKFRRLEQP